MIFNSVDKLLFFVFIFAVLLPISVFPFYIFMKFTRVNSDFFIFKMVAVRHIGFLKS